MIEFERDKCGDFETASSLEWLETNGVGGYASGTVSGANTRRYHGLLVAALEPPLGRTVLVSKLEETLIVDGESFELSSNQYPGTIHPTGFEQIAKFRLDPFPIWTYEVGGVVLERKLFMSHGENTTVVTWTIVDRGSAAALALEVRPLLACRDFHHLRQDAGDLTTKYRATDDAIVFAHRGESEIVLSHNAALVGETGHWYRDFEYAIERERGFDFTEQLYQPCVLKFDPAKPAVIIFSTEMCDVAKAETLERSELKRRAELIVVANADDEITQQLVLAADQFIVTRGEGKTVIAGYHWFSDWGRDTMIALPGLTLATRRPEIAKSILSEFAKHISDGMIPNRFPDAGEVPEYNTVDATLWFFEAIRAYLEATGDEEFVRGLYDRLVDIIEWHTAGTRYGIRVEPDGLLHAGEPGVQLTWMDAKVGDNVITPRIGKPVEIQALWYNALCVTADLAGRFGDAENRDRFTQMAAITRESFNGQFWYERGGYLFDVIGDSEKDASLRPNQIFAVSLAHSMLDKKRARTVVDVVERELLTDVGLRSLASTDERYVGEYFGSPEKRDSSYHQGTVWSWLIGPFIDAYRKVHAQDADLEPRVDQMLGGLKEHLDEAMLGQISEIFDGDASHDPRGAAAQAWSVAELARLLLTK